MQQDLFNSSDGNHYHGVLRAVAGTSRGWMPEHTSTVKSVNPMLPWPTRDVRELPERVYDVEKIPFVNPLLNAQEDLLLLYEGAHQIYRSPVRHAFLGGMDGEAREDVARGIGKLCWDIFYHELGEQEDHPLGPLPPTEQDSIIRLTPKQRDLRAFEAAPIAGVVTRLGVKGQYDHDYYDTLDRHYLAHTQIMDILKDVRTAPIPGGEHRANNLSRQKGARQAFKSKVHFTGAHHTTVDKYLDIGLRKQRVRQWLSLDYPERL